MEPSRSSDQPASWVELLASRASEQPDDEVLYFLPTLQEIEVTHTHHSLDQAARAVAATLQQAGAKGERALLVFDNHPDYLIAFLGCLYAGCVGVTVLLPMRPKHLDRLAHIAEDADATWLITGPGFSPRLRNAVDSVPLLASLKRMEVPEVPLQRADEWIPHFPSRDDVAYLQYTSGSTRAPRGVVVTHRDLMEQARLLAKPTELDANDRALCWIPMFHDMGLILGVLQPMYCGTPLYLTRPLAFVKHPGRWLQAVSDHRITFTGGPDFAYSLCSEVVDPAKLDNLDLSCLSMALTAAEPVRAASINRFLEVFEPYGFQRNAFQPGYGLAEATLAVSIKPRHNDLVTREVDASALVLGVAQAAGNGPTLTVVSSGRILDDLDVRIVSDAQAVPDGGIGEIWVRSPSPTLGYWRREDESASTFSVPLGETSFTRTGDLGFIDDGELFVTGRLKDVIVVHGSNHFPSDIEQTVEEASGVIRPHFTAAFGMEIDNKEAVVVVAEVRRGAVEELDVEKVGREIRRTVMSTHAVPVHTIVLLQQGQLPKTTSGKIQRGRARALWTEGSFTAHGTSLAQR